MAGAQMHMALAPRYGLTARERDCLNAIEGYVMRHARAPSLTDLGALLGLSSKSGVYRLVEGLEQRGWVRKLPNRARSIEIVSQPVSAGSRAFILPQSVQATLDAHCRLIGEHPDNVVADAVALFLDQAEADAA